MLLVMKIDSLIHSMLKSVRSISDVTFLQPDLDQLKVFLICLLKARRTFVLNVATSLLQKGLGLDRLIMLCLVFLILDICSRTEIMRVCWYMDSVLLKSDVENVLVPFLCACVCPFFLDKEL